MQIKNINDYCLIVQLKFPDLTVDDIKRICSFGFKRLYLSNICGGDVHINGNDLWMYIGHLTKNSLFHFKRYKRKLGIKIRIMNKRMKIPWDGYYYFGVLDKDQFKIEQEKKKRGRPRKNFTYGNVVLYRLLEECKVRESDKRYIYRVPYIAEIGNTKYIKNYTTDKAELIITREPLKFTDILVTNNKYTYGR